ncbi:hypothetical protein CMUS01_07704 [Colletotrichum musicola]|uniref:Uncharacterized protein n=1 Tax=Colletotrichum musicola TaxID=2175873 RepID=A0A8H6KFC0_9PEZI|nr:hypothetical protein CMUS01_07704 [Colletotrichum musicola]
MLTGVEIIGLVSAVITFIDFAAENVAVAREIGKSGSAAVKGDADLERRVKLLDERIKNVYSCGAVQLLSLLAGLKSTRKRDVLFKSAKNMFKKGQKESLIQDLDECRAAIHLQLTQVMRHDMNRRLDEISDQGHNQIAELRQLRTSTAALESSLGNWQQVPGLAEEVRAIVRQASDAIDRNAREQILKELWIEGMEDRFEEVDEAHESTFNWLLDSDDFSSEEDGTSDDDDYFSEDMEQESYSETEGSSLDDDEDDNGEDDDGDGATPEEVQARQKIVN